MRFQLSLIYRHILVDVDTGGSGPPRRVITVHGYHPGVGAICDKIFALPIPTSRSDEAIDAYVLVGEPYGKFEIRSLDESSGQFVVDGPAAIESVARIRARFHPQLQAAGVAQ